MSSSSIILPKEVVSLVNAFVQRNADEFDILRMFYNSLGNMKMTKLVEICSGFDIFEVLLKKYQTTVMLHKFIKNTKYTKDYRIMVCVKQIFNRILWLNKTQGMLIAFRNICEISQKYCNVKGTVKMYIEDKEQDNQK
jgi:hypothetical protein